MLARNVNMGVTSLCNPLLLHGGLIEQLAEVLHHIEERNMYRKINDS